MHVCMMTSVPIPPTEGVGYYVWALSGFLMEQGHQVQIITRGHRGKPFHEIVHGIPVWRPRFYPTYPLHVHLHGLFVQRLVQRLEAQVDVFHLHTPLPPDIRSTRPVLLTIHSMMLADARARRVDSVFELLSRLQTPVSTQIERRLLRTSRIMVAVSKEAAENAQHTLPQDDRRIEIVWNGVDDQFFSPFPNHTADHNRLLFVGRLAPGKGLEDLLEAMKLVVERHPQANVSVAGNGPLKNRIMSRIERRGLQKHVRLLGHVCVRDRLRTLYQKAWALVLPSHHESLPTVMLEAMACGTPVIATHVGGIPDVITDRVNGLLVPPRSPGILADTICLLLGDPGLRASLGEGARRTVKDRFTWRLVGNRYMSFYDSLLRSGER